METQLPPPEKRGQSLQFLAHARCGQTAGWIKVPLSTKVGLGPGNILLDADKLHPTRHTPPRITEACFSVLSRTVTAILSNLLMISLLRAACQ